MKQVPKILIVFFFICTGQDTSTCTREPTKNGTMTLPRCPETNTGVPFVLAVYMVLTNLMLMNLLIAMFS